MHLHPYFAFLHEVHLPGPLIAAICTQLLLVEKFRGRGNLERFLGIQSMMAALPLFGNRIVEAVVSAAHALAFAFWIFAWYVRARAVINATYTQFFLVEKFGGRGNFE